MKKKDLIELLSSIVEEDAIISRIYNLFHEKLHYDIQEIERILQYGILQNIFVISDVNNPEKHYDSIIWERANIYQEITLIDDKEFIHYLFKEKPELPLGFSRFEID
jgi:hypothetical protein